MGRNLIRRSVCVGDRSRALVSVPHARVDVPVPVRHLSLPVFAPVLELSVKDVSVSMAHDSLPLKPGQRDAWVDEIRPHLPLMKSPSYLSREP